ncbi:MAG: hypothetical protein AAGM67_08115 [Bacteroidota bacterium]
MLHEWSKKAFEDDGRIYKEGTVVGVLWKKRAHEWKALDLEGNVIASASTKKRTLRNLLVLWYGDDYDKWSSIENTNKANKWLLEEPHRIRTILSKLPEVCDEKGFATIQAEDERGDLPTTDASQLAWDLRLAIDKKMIDFETANYIFTHLNDMFPKFAHNTKKILEEYHDRLHSKSESEPDPTTGVD